jgi:hypothetical protein
MTNTSGQIIALDKLETCFTRETQVAVASTIRKVIDAGYYIAHGEKRTEGTLHRSEFLCCAISGAACAGFISHIQESEARDLIRTIVTRATLGSHLANTNQAYLWRLTRYGHAAKCLFKLRMAYWNVLLNILENGQTGVVQS